MKPSPAFFDCAESALLVDFGPQYGKQLSLAILMVSELLNATILPGLKETVPALSSLTVLYDPLELSRDRIVREIERLWETCVSAPASGRLWKIPVAYGGGGGPDLEDVARRAGLSVDAAIALHTGAVYDVYMIGFLPGFAYLGDLPRGAAAAAPGHSAGARAGGIGCDRCRDDGDLSPGKSRRVALSFDRAPSQPLGYEPAKGASFPAGGPGAVPAGYAGGSARAWVPRRRRLDPAVHGGGVTGFLRIIDPGVAATLQDCGRLGFSVSACPSRARSTLSAWASRTSSRATRPPRRRWSYWAQASR